MMKTQTKMLRRLLQGGCLCLALMLAALAMVSCAASGGIAQDRDNAADKGMSSEDYFGVAEDSMSGGSSLMPSMPPSKEEPSPAPDESGKTEDTAYATKIIRTVTQRAQTKTFDTAIGGLETLVAQHGGYVESSYVHGAGYQTGNGSRSAEYTIRIPAEQLDAFLSEAGALYVVTYNNSSVSNVTAQYYDIVTRLETLRAEQESLQNMLTEAKDISTMLQIKDYLYQVIYEIESYETQLKLMDSRISYSTLHLTINEVVEYTEVEQSWGERLVVAFKQSWIAFADGFQGFTVFFVAAFPTLLVLGAIAAVVVVIVIRTNKKHRPKQPPKDGE